MNIECSTPVLEELNSSFRFNDAVIRNLVISRKEAVTEPSLLIKKPDEKREREPRDDSAGDADRASSDEESAEEAAAS
jgi:small subunit ribosomal protein S6